MTARGIFKSSDDLARKLLRYICEHNKTAQPIKWKYIDVQRRIRGPLSFRYCPLASAERSSGAVYQPIDFDRRPQFEPSPAGGIGTNTSPKPSHSIFLLSNGE